MDFKDDGGGMMFNISSAPIFKKKKQHQIQTAKNNEEIIPAKHSKPGNTQIKNFPVEKEKFSKPKPIHNQVEDFPEEQEKSTHSPKKKSSSHSQEKSTNSPKKKSSSHSQEFKSKPASEIIHSSLFKSNPEVHPLTVRKQSSLSEPLFSTKTFEEIDLHPHLVSCLKSRMNIVRMTKVQENSIPVLLRGEDALVKSCTGSGKTLAYAIPIIQKLQEINPKIKRTDGIHVLVIVPTRELALQCYESFLTLTKAFVWIVPGYLIGGEKKKSEKARLRKGINILISTPGRLLDHLDTTACLSLEKISWLVIDEADRLLEQGFGDSVKRIIFKCNKERNSVLLSATLSKEVENLAMMSLTDPVHIDIGTDDNNGEFSNFIVPVNLKQFVVVVPSKLRLTTLSGFIVDNCMKGNFKALIFMCSQDSIDFHYSLFSSVLSPLLSAKECKCKFFRLHGNLKQEERTEIFSKFRKEREGVLLCTDVAARGLDLPHVDWIVQYSAPSSPETYIHRVGRTARIGKRGNSLLFLLPSESKYSHLLAEHRIDFEEVTSDKFLQPLMLISDLLMRKPKVTAEDCATVLHTKYENEVYAEEELHKIAKDAFASYVKSYTCYPKTIRYVLPFKDLHLGHVAKSFCLREAPSALGCSKFIRKESHFERKSFGSKPMKRKNTVISEFDSGLSSGSVFPRKKKRKHKN